MTHSHRIASARRRDGFALVLTLAMVVLVTFAVVAYFTRATSNRRVESASSSAIRADILARSASEIILSDLRTEMVAGSTLSQPSTLQMPIYIPTDAQKMIPSRVLAGSTTGATFNNLVKQSVGRFFPSAGYGTQTPLITATTGKDTSVVSVNNKTVGTARWNAPVLNTNSGFSATNQLPEWVLFSRNGVSSSQSWSNTFKDYTPGTDNAVIGRFAFNVYDVGGLLDSSVAGLPVYSTQLTDAQVQQLKSTQTGASLYDRVTSTAIIPGFDAVMQTNFVNNWRFKSSSTSSANTLSDFMTSNVPPTFADSGFMRPTTRSGSSNSMAFSRQDLLRAAPTSSPTPFPSPTPNSYLPIASLPYFTHFTRELNAPSWSPTTPAGSTIDYAALADQATASNRNVLNVRVKAPFVRADGTSSVVGELLLKNRYPLRRLDGIVSTGVNAGGFPVILGGSLQAPTAVTVQRDFGVIWNSVDSRWDYVGASGSTVQTTIATLDQVATANREPNFCEILKAFILSGSIGFGSDTSGTGRTIVNAEPRYYQQPFSSDSQIIQIGANIIDQWDSDKNPTFIFFNGVEHAGVENIPYLNKLIYQPRWVASPVSFGSWLMPSLWMAGQNGTTSVGTQSATVPAIRFVMTAGTASAVVESATGSAVSTTVTGSATQPIAQLVPSATWSPPNTMSTSSTPNAGMTPQGPNAKLGVPFVFSTLGTVTQATTIRTYPKLNGATFEMQAQIGGVSGPWKTYQRWPGCTINVSSVTSAFDTYVGVSWTGASNYDPEYVLLDPRTMRFGVWESHASGTADTSDYTRGFNETLEKSAGIYQKITGFGPQGGNFTGVGAEMANNNLLSPSYIDRDGIKRGGDKVTSGASAMLPANAVDRPPILSRQIRTVAELGTVFRGQPWKTLNFTTADSGDVGLLDAFTIFEPNSFFRSDIVAGKLSLNTRQSLVIEAVLAGISTSTNASPLPLITAAQRTNIANALVAMTTAQPMINKSELVTRFAADPSVISLGNKEAREAVIRALSDVGQTRTWNLMIDVIAQSGRYGASASIVENFIVEGEKRYWLHVAIDRFTGEVIDQQLEKINE